MLFITNREPKGSIRIKKGRGFKFDLNRNAPSNSIYYCEQIAKDEYKEIGSEGLISKLRNCDKKQLLFYIHGFSNLPEPNIFPKADRLQKYLDAKESGLVKVIPMIWPCDNDLGIVTD